MKTPFWKEILLSLWSEGSWSWKASFVSSQDLPSLLSQLNWESLPGFTEANPTIWCIYLSNLGTQKLYSAPTAAFSSEWSRHLLSCLASSYTCTPCVQSWPCPWAGTAEEGWVCPARRRPVWSEQCGCAGWGLEGGEWRTALEPTVQLLQQVWLVLGAQRQLCFSSNSR